MLSVSVDARVLVGEMDGTKRHVLELTGALAGREDLEVRALVAPDLDPAVRQALHEAGVQLADAGSTGAREPTDVVHRPHQIDSPADLAVLAGLGRRLLITHQDTIAFETAAQFASAAAWSGYRHLTRLSLLSADRVVLPSAHVQQCVLAEQLVEPHRTSVVPLGVDHPLTGALAPEPAPPGRAAALGDCHELLLCLGADYEHKNRPLALQVAAELRRRHGWNGRLVLAGAHVEFGSTSAQEAELLRADAELGRACVDLGTVSEAERRWLLDHAQLVLYPSAHEGFGLIPFEAGAHGVPCLWATGTALSEFLPEGEAAAVPGDVAATADHAVALLRDESVRTRHLAAIRRAAAPLTWAAAAQRLATIYGETLEEPPAPASVMLRQDGVMQSGFSEDAVRLVGPDGLLPADVERPLLALASHRRLGEPVFGALKLGYRLLRRGRS